LKTTLRLLKAGTAEPNHKNFQRDEGVWDSKVEEESKTNTMVLCLVLLLSVLKRLWAEDGVYSGKAISWTKAIDGMVIQASGQTGALEAW
jgi:hypothetical protein